jgi:hypothetical protein
LNKDGTPAVLAVVMLVSCVEHAPQAVAIAPLPVVTQSIEPVVETRAPKASIDDGDFSSDKGGMVHLVAAPDGTLAGTYPNGVLTCTAALACLWYEGSANGRATFQRKHDGTLAGTWGNGESDADGGGWTLVPIKRSGTLDGVWDTNWGVAKIETTRAGVHIEYSDGTMDCTTRGTNLACTWNENSASGAAELAIESERVIRGRWGTGASSSDGGVWVFVRR